MFLTGKQGTQYDAYNNFCLLSSHLIPGTDWCKDVLTVVLRPAHLFFIHQVPQAKFLDSTCDPFHLFIPPNFFFLFSQG